MLATIWPWGPKPRITTGSSTCVVVCCGWLSEGGGKESCEGSWMVQCGWTPVEMEQGRLAHLTLYTCMRFVPTRHPPSIGACTLAHNPRAAYLHCGCVELVVAAGCPRCRLPLLHLVSQLAAQCCECGCEGHGEHHCDDEDLVELLRQQLQLFVAGLRVHSSGRTCVGVRGGRSTVSCGRSMRKTKVAQQAAHQLAMDIA